LKFAFCPTLSQNSVSWTLSMVAPAGMLPAMSNSTPRGPRPARLVQHILALPVNIVGPAPSLRSAKPSGAIGS
jgi:hypothetical protein